jgi:hypothetical protein
MPRVFYLPGTDGADFHVDAATGTRFDLDPDGRAVAIVDEGAAAKLRQSPDCWVEGDEAKALEEDGADAAEVDSPAPFVPAPDGAKE